MARIRHIALVVKDLEQTANFYQKAFGLTPLRDFRRADGAAHLHERWRDQSRIAAI